MRIGLRETLAVQKLQKDLGVTARHLGMGLAFCGLVAEMPPPVDHLFRRAAADAELQTAAGNQVGRARILDHVERVLVAHVDHARADLDRRGARADGGEKRKRRSELAGEMVDAEIGPVEAQFLGGHGQFDRLQQRVGCGPHLRIPVGRPVPE